LLYDIESFPQRSSGLLRARAIMHATSRSVYLQKRAIHDLGRTRRGRASEAIKAAYRSIAYRKIDDLVLRSDYTRGVNLSHESLSVICSVFSCSASSSHSSTDTDPKFRKTRI